MQVNLYPHQLKAISKLHNGSVLVGGVGTGKSITSLAYYYTKVCGGTIGTLGSMKTPRDLYIITTAKKRDSLDWESDAVKFGIGREQQYNVDGVKFVVDSWNNISKYKEIRDAFFIFDEQRLVGSGTWVKAFIEIAKHNEWVLLSATPGDTWLDYIPVFLANGFYKNRTQFKREHVVYNTYSKFPKVDRYISTGKLVRLRNQILVDMPYERHTTRHSKIVKVDYDRDLYEKVVKDRWHVYENRPLKDIAETFGVMRRVVNSDASRLESLTSLLSSHPRLIVFYNFNYELEMLRTLRPNSLMSSTSAGRLPMSDESAKTTSELLRKNCGKQEGFWIESPDGMGELWIPDNLEMCDLSDLTLGELSEMEALLYLAEENRRSLGETPERKRTSSRSTSTETSTDEFEKRQQPESDSNSSIEGRTSSSSFAIAEWNGQKHEPIPKTDSWVYLVQYYAGAEGWNCIETDAIVFYSQTYSYKQYEQAHGRIDRLNTPFTDLYYYNFVSDSSIDSAIRRSLRQKRSFNEREHSNKL